MKPEMMHSTCRLHGVDLNCRTAALWEFTDLCQTSLQCLNPEKVMDAMGGSGSWRQSGNGRPGPGEGYPTLGTVGDSLPRARQRGLDLALPLSKGH